MAISSNLLLLPIIIFHFDISLAAADNNLGRKTPSEQSRLPTDNLVEFLVQNVQHPSSSNCNYKDAFKTWLLSCSQQDSDSTANILERVVSFGMVKPHFGPHCRVNGQCNMTGQPDTVTLQHFQANYLDKLTSVIRQDRCQQHFNAADLFKEANVDPNQTLTWQQLGEVLSATGNRLLNGECIRGSSDEGAEEAAFPNEYLDAVFVRYSNVTDDVGEEGIRQLLQDVNLKVSEDDKAGQARTEDNGSKVSGLATPSLQEHLLRERRSFSNHSASNATDLNLNLRGWFQKSKKPILGFLEPAHECLESQQVLSYFDADNSSTLNKDEFLQMLAYIVYQISSGNACVEEEDDTRNFNAAQAYGYGTLCVFIISACSALGFVIIPLLPASIYETMMACFIALAFGTLTADAVLHMLPEALITEDETDGGHGEMAPPSFYKCLVITLSIYGLFVFETLTHLLTTGRSKEGGDGHEHHGHSHVVDITVVKSLAKPQEKDNGAIGYSQFSERSGSVQISVAGENMAAPTIKDMVSGQEQIPVCLGLTTLALVIIVGDAVHNVTDGIAIGAGFAANIGEGFSTALAVLFHELPHEFGDFVILLMTGMSLKQALVWNFLTSLTSFIGLYIGIIVGTNEAANQWIFSITAGMFLYVAVADMLPELRNMKVKNRWQAFFAQNVGAQLGIGFMVLMYFLEDLIKF